MSLRTTAGANDAIYPAAIDLFAEHGYEATTLRMLSDAVGLQVGSLYNYIVSKEDLLFSIMRNVMVALCEEAEEAVSQSSDPATQIDLFFLHAVRFHADRKKETFVGNTELRALSPANRATIVGLRDRYESILRVALRACAAKGLLPPSDVRLATYAAIAMATHVSTWYRDDGELSIEEVALGLRRMYAPFSDLEDAADQVRDSQEKSSR